MMCIDAVLLQYGKFASYAFANERPMKKAMNTET